MDVPTSFLEPFWPADIGDVPATVYRTARGKGLVTRRALLRVSLRVIWDDPQGQEDRETAHCFCCCILTTVEPP